MIDDQRNINLTENEVLDLERGLKALVEQEQDQKDYSDLYYKLKGWFE